MRRLGYLAPLLVLLLACLPPFQGPSPKPLPNPTDGHQWHLRSGCSPSIRCIVWIDRHSDGWYNRGPYAPQYGPAYCAFMTGDEYLSEGDFHTVSTTPPYCP